MHWLVWQLCPPPHTEPQPPQLFESDDVSTHAPLHAVCPEGQLTLPPVPGEPPVPGLGLEAGVQAAATTAKKSPKSETRPVFIVTPFNFQFTWGGRCGALGPHERRVWFTACRRTW